MYKNTLTLYVMSSNSRHLQVVAELNATLGAGGPAAYDVFFNAFLSIAFRPEVMDGNTVSVVNLQDHRHLLPSAFIS